MRKGLVVGLAMIGLVAVQPAVAQAPHEAWRTLEVDAFRVHYPVPYERWAEHVASRLASVRETVEDAIGFAPDATIDVLVMDPIGRANGSAWPFLERPRMILWAQPPGAASGIGHYVDWPELLLLHEQVHLVHLLRPSRAEGFMRFLRRRTPLGPIPLAAPRWLTEGYATLLEGRLTGAGRPNAELRAALLRQLARDGALPSYGGLNGSSKRFPGGAMAYLGGSAFLEWLDRDGDGRSFDALWRRLTARETRSFAEAFAGVYGAPPAELYRRFRAEVVWRALEVERELAAEESRGEPWIRLRTFAGSPTVSEDGERVALVTRPPGEPPRVSVWSTSVDEEATERRAERIERMLEEDPEDVAPVESPWPLVRRLGSVPTVDGSAPEAPRYLPGGALLLTRDVSDADGFRSPDLFLRQPGGDERRVTHGASVRDADPAPDGSFAVGVRRRFGTAQLVRVELSTGAIDEVTPASVERVDDHPRVSPDGTEVVFTRHENGRWRLMRLDLATREATELPLPDTCERVTCRVAQPAWMPDGRSVVAALGRSGFVDLAVIPVDADGAPRFLTRTLGAAIAPEPDPEGRFVYYLALESRGFDLRRVDASSALGERPAVERVASGGLDYGPVTLPMKRSEPVSIEVADLPESTPYGFGKQELETLAPTFVFAPSARQVQLGLQGGDVLGRTSWLAAAAFGEQDGPEGLAAAGQWRGYPVTLGVHAFAVRERPSEQRDAPILPSLVPGSSDGLGRGLDTERYGVEVDASWGRRVGAQRVALGAGVAAGSIERRDADDADSRAIGFLRAAFERRRSIGQWSWAYAVDGRADLGRTGDDDWSRWRGGASLEGGYGGGVLRATYDRGAAASVESPFDAFVVGGLDSTLLPSTELGGRVASPALAYGVDVGTRFDATTLELMGAVGPTGVPGISGRMRSRVFASSYRAWSSGEARGERTEIVGVEMRVFAGPSGILRQPGLELRVGAAFGIEGVIEDRARGWIHMVWRP